MIGRTLRLVGLGSFIVAAATACGSSGGGSPTPTEPNVGFECKGTVSDGAGDTILLPTGANGVPALDICDPQDISATDAVNKCTTKCNNMLQSYADFINNTTGKTIMVSQLTCSIAQFEQINSDCPNMDPPGIPDPPFSGGPSQYVANLTGSLHFAVNVDVGITSFTVSADSPTSGQVGYTIVPLDRVCPPQGCALLMTSLTAAVADFDISASFLGVTIFDHNIQNMHLQNAGWVVGTWQPDGHFEIPAQAGDIVATLSDNGAHTSVDRHNSTPITGTIDPVAGTVSFDTFTQADGDTTITLSGFSGLNILSPPNAVISTPSIVECNQTNSAAVTLDGSASTSSNGPLHLFSWSVNGGPTLSGVTVPAVLNLGANDVVLDVFNQVLGIGATDATITVVDTTAPTFGPLPPITDTTCDPRTQSSPVPTPIATDTCSPTVSVTGVVISSNGVTLNPPLPIVNGQVLLAAGVHVVRWTAVDQSGQTATATQTVNVRAGVQASNSISVEDRGLVKLPGSGFASLGNTGTGQVTIGVQAQTGSIVTGGGVFLRDRSTVNGNLLAAGALTRQNQTTVTGTITTGTPITLPPGRDLSGITFPSTNAGSVTLPPGTSQTLAPGSYAAVTVFSRSQLTVSAGTYFMSSLDLEPQSRLILDQSAGPIQIYVRQSLIIRGQIAPSAGAPGGFVLGYAGTQSVTISTPFLAGTLIAPSAGVVISSLGAGAFSGELFARDIDIQPGATLTCDPVGRTAQQAGL